MSRSAIRHRVEEASDHVVLGLRGELTLRTVPTVRQLLDKLLLDRGHVLLDLSGLRVGWAPAVDVFPTCIVHTGGWPAARLVIFGADDETTRALRAADVPASVPLAGGREAARELLGRRPTRVRRCTGLPADPGAARWARAFTELTCQDWDLRPVSDTAVVVVNELATNAVEHARTESELALGLDRSGLHVAVRDGDPATAGQVPSPDTVAPHGMGLFLVAQLSRSCGVTVHLDGKTVWAVLSVS